MKKESKCNRNSKRQADCSCSIPEKDITNLASWTVQEGKGTHNSNLAMAAQTGIEMAKCCSRISVPQDRDSVDGYRSNSYGHHTKPLQSPSNQEKQLWLQPVKACMKILP